MLLQPWPNARGIRMKFSGYMIQVVLFSPKLSEDKKGLHQKLKDISSLNRVKTKKKRVLTAIWHRIRPELVGFICVNRYFFVQSSEVESKTQGSRPRPRTHKNFEAKNRPSRSKDQGPRTQTQVFSKKKKKRSSKIFFKRSQRKVFKKVFQAKKVFKNFVSDDLYLKKPKKGLCRFSARFLAFSNEISTVQK